MNLYDKALGIATKAHKGQVDKAGVDYIQHPLYVASLVTGEHAKATALLHDVVEDSAYTFGDLRKAGFPEDIIEAVTVLTKSKGIRYNDYLQRVKQNELARKVKLADLHHNSDLSRLTEINDKDLKRIEKYKKAIEYLE